MTLIAKQGRGTYATSRTYLIQDKAALAQLQQRYAAMVGTRKPRHPWTQAETVELGRLYRQAYGLLPTSNRCRAELNMPDTNVVKRLWGTFGAWVDAVAQEGGGGRGEGS
jgi:hypothetical protein